MAEPEVRMLFGYSVDRNSLGSRAICYAAGGAWAHSFIIFEYREKTRGKKAGRILCREYYESRVTPCKFTDREGVERNITDGLRGPLPYSGLEKWVESDRKNHRHVKQPVFGHSQEDVLRARDMLDELIKEGKSSYAKIQIYKNAKYLMLGNAGWAFTRTPEDITCCEIQYLCLNDEAYRFCGAGRYTLDQTFPSGNKWHLGNFENVNRWNNYVIKKANA